ncbi:MAG: M67 family metallopeptidase [Desulfurococcaceae archaeon]
MVTLIVPSKQLKRVVKDSLNSSVEKVFIGIGHRSGNVYVVKDLHECPNIAEKPSTRFEADPLCLYDIHRKAESWVLEIVVLVHSHPAQPVPSAEDRKGMEHWPLPWLIVSSLTGDYKAWMLVNGELHEVTVEESS